MERADGIPGAIEVACNIDHVEELAIQWMTTGGLDYPLARLQPGSGRLGRMAAPSNRVDISGARQLGELAVPRESMEPILAENPNSLKAILDALLEAMRQEPRVQSESVALQEAAGKEGKELCSVSTEP